jgi:hypothetical protein
MKQRLVAALTLACVTISSCVAYVPTTLELAPQAGTVRLSLSPDARTQSFGVLGSQIESIEGRVRSVADSGITVSAEAVSRIDDDDQRFRGETALIPSRYVVSVSRKHTQVVRSLVLAGLITGGLIWIGASLGGGSVGYNRVPTPQPGQN